MALLSDEAKNDTLGYRQWLDDKFTQSLLSTLNQLMVNRATRILSKRPVSDEDKDKCATYITEYMTLNLVRKNIIEVEEMLKHEPEEQSTD